MLSIVSSSFLIAAELLDQLTILPQSAFEYVFNGVVACNAKVFKELNLCTDCRLATF